MSFGLKHPQPFDLRTAVQLDISTIIDEISRLQRSLEHLRSSQVQLEEYLNGSKDTELADAFEENKHVIASQEERVGMLRHALELKGGSVASNPHYTLHEPSVRSRSAELESRGILSQQRTPNDPSDSEGVFL